MLDLQTIRANTTLIARQAGAVHLHYFNKPFEQTTKALHTDIVTEADKAAEAFIVPALLKLYPTHHLVGEEGSAVGAAPDEAEYFWYIDPIDGTTNFANAIPFFCVSIALTDKQGTPLVGVVYNAVSDELFSAARGFGATLNDQPIRVSNKTDLSQCVIASGFPYHKADTDDNNLREWQSLLLRTRDLRRMGSAALDLCFVACGRYDGYWEQYLNAWDYLGGALCVLEAGGVVSDYTGEIDYARNQSLSASTRAQIAAANPAIHAQMTRLLTEARQGLRV
jgi:myo-inositol-1(or 4)-monophosphatase